MSGLSAVGKDLHPEGWTMNRLSTVFREGPLISRWRREASALLSEDTVSKNEKVSGSSGAETVGAGAIEAMVLWHKTSHTELLSHLHKAASEMMKRGVGAMEAMRQLYSMAKAMLLWREHWIPSEPHEELIPWVAWFRPISARNYVWLYTWPEEEYLHP
jgi:hypothetical protein